MSPLRLIPFLLVLLAETAVAKYARVDIPVTANGTTGTLHLYIFDSRTAALKIIDQGGMDKQNYKNLDHAMTSHHCFAGCNGGFFGKDGNPLGLVIADGKKSGTPNLASSLTSGVLGQGTGRPFIERATSYFKNGAQSHRQVLQSGPLLVEDGKVVAGLDARKYARRTIVLTDGGSQWAIAYAPAVPLALLAEALANPKTFPLFKIQYALNLDGGSSSGFWMRRDHHPFYLRELGKVRNFVGVVKK